MNIVKRGKAYEKDVKFHTSSRVFNNKKVESHSAIMPTYMVPKKLPADEKIVYEAVVNRFIMQFMPVAEHEEASLTSRVRTESGQWDFISKGRIQLVKGWKQVEDIQSKTYPFLPLKQGIEYQ